MNKIFLFHFSAKQIPNKPYHGYQYLSFHWLNNKTILTINNTSYLIVVSQYAILL